MNYALTILIIFFVLFGFIFNPFKDGDESED